MKAKCLLSAAARKPGQTNSINVYLLVFVDQRGLVIAQALLRGTR